MESRYYFSKWRKEWVLFKDSHGIEYKPTEGEIKELLKYKYKIK